LWWRYGENCRKSEEITKFEKLEYLYLVNRYFWKSSGIRICFSSEMITEEGLQELCKKITTIPTLESLTFKCCKVPLEWKKLLGKKFRFWIWIKKIIFLFWIIFFIWNGKFLYWNGDLGFYEKFRCYFSWGVKKFLFQL